MVNLKVMTLDLMIFTELKTGLINIEVKISNNHSFGELNGSCIFELKYKVIIAAKTSTNLRLDSLLDLT